MTPPRSLRALLVAAATLGLTATTLAQCQSQWLTMPGIPPGWLATAAVEWDPDRSGPLSPLVVVAGWFPSIGGVTANNIGAYDPVTNSWSALGAGTNAQIFSLTVMPSGELIAGGRFTSAGGQNADRIASWDGTTWSPLGSGVAGPNNATVFALTTMQNGDLVAGGSFVTAGGAPAFAIARWDGANWSTLAGGMNAAVHSLFVLPNGDLVAGGYFDFAGSGPANRIARWNGTGWSQLGAGPGLPLSSWVTAFAQRPNGDLIAGASDFPFFMGTPVLRVLRWDGSAWSTIASAATPPLVTAVINALSALPNGDVIAGGDWGGALSNRYLARWNGSAWSAVSPAMHGPVHAIAPLSNGELTVAGSFTSVGNTSVERVARLSTTCPAAVSVAGAGCAGAGGTNELIAANAPWTGSTFRGNASGLTTNALALSLFGLAASAIPLSTLVQQAVPGCALLASTESVRHVLPVGGTVETRLTIPNSMAFAGVVLHHQVIAAELTAPNAVTAVTSTNALTLTIGTF